MHLPLLVVIAIYQYSSSLAMFKSSAGDRMCALTGRIRYSRLRLQQMPIVLLEGRELTRYPYRSAGNATCGDLGAYPLGQSRAER
jgi:hypothetical protein